MAVLAAYMYATTRTSLRVSCMVSSAPQSGLADFRWAVHSTPNLNMCRLELGKTRGGGGGGGVGHVLRLTPASNNKPATVQLLKFGGDQEQQQPHAGLGRSLLLPAKQKEKDVSEYVSLLEDLYNARTWPKDYHNEVGAGVRGKVNEARQMA